MTSSWADFLIQGMETIQGTGWTGCFLFVALYALLCVLCLPASILTFGAGAIYGFWGGTLLVSLSNVVGAVISLLISRYLVRGWVRRWLDRHPRFQAIDDAVERDGGKIVFLTRLSPVMPFSIINYCLGLTRIAIAPFALASWLGILPSTAAYAFIGHLTGKVTVHGPAHIRENPWFWSFQAVGFLATIILTVVSARLATRALSQKGVSSPSENPN
jgi:uncharacterized membrane protein YdjX (TVP38/TMEM64 family)